jgi:hypothetical protein
MDIVNWMMTLHAWIKFSKQIVKRNETSRMRGVKSIADVNGEQV